MADSEIVVSVVQDPALITAEGEAEAARIAAEAAQAAARTLEAQVVANAADEIREYADEVEVLEEQVSWLNQKILALETAMAQISTATSSALVQVTAEMETLKASLIPLPLVPEEVIAAVPLENPESAVENPAPKTSPRPKNRVRLI